MPKLFGRDFPPVMLGAMGLLTIVAFSQVLGGGAETSATKKRPKTQSKKLSADSDYLETDYRFQIAPLGDSVQAKDAFKPLVSKGTADKAGTQSIDSFSYSGMAQLNGVANGLLENSTTGQGDFVQEGQTWHDHTVVKVTGDSIVMRNSNGDVLTLLAGVSASKAGPTAAAGTAPVPQSGNPIMVGPIGSSDISIQADANAGGNQNQGGRRRGRRGGGGVGTSGG
jgi:hypothetical protein